MEMKKGTPKSRERCVLPVLDVKKITDALGVGNTLNDRSFRRALGLVAEQDCELDKKLDEIIADKEKSAAFAKTVFDQINEDEGMYEKVGRYMAEAIRSGNINTFLLALCGWSADTLVRLSEEEKKFD